MKPAIRGRGDHIDRHELVRIAELQGVYPLLAQRDSGAGLVLRDTDELGLDVYFNAFEIEAGAQLGLGAVGVLAQLLGNREKALRERLGTRPVDQRWPPCCG